MKFIQYTKQRKGELSLIGVVKKHEKRRNGSYTGKRRDVCVCFHSSVCNINEPIVESPLLLDDFRQ